MVAADCVPLLLADGEAGVVGVVHAGWRGVRSDVVGAALEAMVELGARAEQVRALVGPAICGSCYDVSRERFDEVVAVAPAAAAVATGGRPGLDLRAAVVSRLRGAGASVTLLGGCTFESPELYSFRRDPVTGRHGGRRDAGRAMTGRTDPDARVRELAANLAEVRARIATAATAARRAPEDVTLVVVTKTWPASDVALLAALGVTDVGENRDQEARPKYEALPGLGLRWHFVGQLQRNKARSVASYADVVQSVDRAELVGALDRAAGELGRRIDVLVQIDLADPPQPHRGGVVPADLAQLADVVAGCEALRLGGVMAVAPLGADPGAAFAVLRAASLALRVDHPAATMVSAGMSGDLEAAVAAGATHVRVGTAVLGGRAALG